MPGYHQSFATAQGAGAAVTGTGITTLLGASSLAPLPAGSLKVGDRLSVEAEGIMNTVVTTPGTATFTLKFGSVSVFASQAIALNIVAQTNAAWTLKLKGRVVSIGTGTAATILWVGEWISRASLNAPAVGTTNGVGTVLLPDTAPAAGTGFDSTVNNIIDLQVTNSVAGSIQLLGFEFTHRTFTP